MCYMYVQLSLVCCRVLCAGVGFSDVENRVACSRDTVMRIASVSKPITVAIAARLWERQLLDIDATIERYVDDWPTKTYRESKVMQNIASLLEYLEKEGTTPLRNKSEKK